MVEVEAGSMKIHFLSGSWIDTSNAFQMKVGLMAVIVIVDSFSI